MREILIDSHSAMTENERKALAEALFYIESASFSDPWSQKMFGEAFANPVIRSVLLYEDGILAAYALYALIAPEAELLNLAVAPTFRRRGLARALLDDAERYLRGQGVTDVYLEVRKSNTAAGTLYRSRGFCEVGVRRAYYRFPTEDAILMALRLD